ncbi:hypothetical protein NT6N_21360 [Oceaniferula spumae]|uniref:F5/8 type C domain-containing protein n=1 Tax=Oceaniferula spumae TaxID=2979115 RepID=A0AAT9FME9_9BACT
MKSFIPLFPLFLATCSALIAAPSASQLLNQQTETMIAAAKLEDGEVFTRELLSSEEWQRELNDSGPVTDPDKVIQLLFEIWKTDKSLASRKVDRQMATACALEGPRRNWTAEEMLPRYEYFRDKWKYGLLNVMYEDISVFERRYLARGVQHGGLNSMESMEYQNQEVCLPAEKYTGACWYARWILLNPFGDSIHGPNYYAPFQESWDNYAEIIRNVGGVCGSLSNFGAAAAIANGIPAVTMGEPGHCAYAVLTKPENWQPAYSLSWKRGTHTSFYGSTWGWHMLTTKAQQDQGGAHASGDLRRLADYHFSNKNYTKARATIRMARTQHPLDWETWQQSVQILTDSKAADSQWQELHQDVLKFLAPACGEVAFHLLDEFIYPKVLPEGDKNIAARKNILLAWQRASQDWGLARWDYEHAINRQLQLLGKDVVAQDSFMASLFAIHAEKNLFTSDILANQLGRVDKDEKRLQTFLAAIGKSLSKGKTDNFAKVIDTLAAKILPDAAKRGDKATFQYIGKLTAKNFPENKIKPDKFPGILLSSGGTFGIQKPGNRWDNPSRHWGVIEEHGGDFHTDAKPATATIQLGNYGRISGVVIVTRGGNIGRLRGAIIQTSINGTDWTDAHTLSKVSQINRIDLADKDIDAGYVRVIQNNNEPLHFHKFLVYGKKQN